MAFAQRLDVRQSQQLVMTPQLQQAIKMLQMSNLELRDYIVQELEQNPFLEARTPSEPVAEPEAPREPERPTAEARLEDRVANQSLSDARDTFDTGSDTLFPDEAVSDRQWAHAAEAAPTGDGPGGASSLEASAWASVGKGGSARFEDDDLSLEGRAASEETLREALLRQIGGAKIDSLGRAVATHLIEHVDDAGYLRVDLEEMAARLGVGAGVVTAAVSAVQSLEPTGVGARTLQECLRLQLAERDRLDPAMDAFIDHLELLAKGDAEKLKKLCGVDAEDLAEMAAEVRRLDPKPGLAYNAAPTTMVVPDVYVSEGRSGSWRVELSSDTLPRLLVNNSYAAEVGRACRDAEAKEFISERHQTANWLVKSIEQRARTILRVATEIIRQQDGFLAYGVSALRPLNLKTVADAIEMHESTVSRVTSNKYMSTPRGVFELKYFFTPGIASTTGGEAFSAEAIRHRIKALIDAETPDAVLSDDRIVATLKESGVEIARRTVTKYREALGIPSSIQRRKALAALSVL